MQYIKFYLNASKAQLKEMARYQFSNGDGLGVEISSAGEIAIISISCRLDRNYIPGGLYNESDDWNEEDETEEGAIGGYESDDPILKEDTEDMEKYARPCRIKIRGKGLSTNFAIC